MRKQQRLRHWKQHYRPDAEFIWSKCILWGGVLTEPGKRIPEDLAKNRNKVRRLWDSRFIELVMHAPSRRVGGGTLDMKKFEEKPPVPDGGLRF